MILLIVDGGTLFDLNIQGEIMREKKDSLGRELLPGDAAFCKPGSRSSADFPSSPEKINIRDLPRTTAKMRKKFPKGRLL